MITRSIIRKYSPNNEQGFLGAGHVARGVVQGEFQQTDPFIFLMDDMLDKKDYQPVGGPHPHAGFETVSLLIDGEIKEQMESMKKGDFQLMTAGKGTVHTEAIDAPTTGRLLQMWLNLPKENRWTEPRIQILPAEKVPVIARKDINIRVYSGQVEDVISPVMNYTPLLVAELQMDGGAKYSFRIPADFNGFIYVISGNAEVGTDLIRQDQVGWLNVFSSDASSEVNISTDEGVRLLLYAARPTRDAIVSYGPFIAGNQDEIRELYRKYRDGVMTHIAKAPADQKVSY